GSRPEGLALDVAPLLRLPQCGSPVYGDPLAGDVACDIARQERGEMPDVFGGLWSPERDRSFHDLSEDSWGIQLGELGHASLHPGGEVLPRSGPHEARADRVYANVVRRVV